MISLKLGGLAACTLLLAAAAPQPEAAGLQGEWRNTKNTVHLRVAPCGPAMCGTVTWAGDVQRADAKKGSGRELVGSQLLHGLKPAGNATWRGKIYVPDINTNASATVTQLNPRLLRVSGCSMMGIVCKTQHWHRIG